MTIPVSIIMPYFNSEKYFNEAYLSIKAQTAKPAQIIVIDDGSKLKSQQWLDEYKYRSEFDLIRLNQNQGPGYARNSGITKSSQSYIAFLDSDDLWASNKLEVQFDYMMKHPEADITHTGSTIFGNGGEEILAHERPKVLSITQALNFHEMMTPSLILKREVLEEVNGFNPSIKCAGDWELQIRLALAGFKMHYIPDNLLRIRRQGHDSQSSNWARFLIGHQKILMLHRKEYIKHFGFGGWVSIIAREMSRAGYRQKGLVGHALKIPSKLGL